MSKGNFVIGLIIACVCACYELDVGTSSQRLDTGPTFVQVASQPLGSSYVEVDGYMEGRVDRADGSVGSYKVPTKIVYPLNASACNGTAIEDILNSVLYGTHPDVAGTVNDPLFPSVFPFARLLLGDDYIQRNGFVYASVQWNKLVIERQQAAGTESDSSLSIERGTDSYFVLRDLSRVLRNPAALFQGAVVPCAARDVVGFGFSQTGFLLRDFHMTEANRQLANGPDFDDGLVFEGSTAAVAGATCRRMRDEAPYERFEVCPGVTRADSGKVMELNAESDVQAFSGWLARPAGNDAIFYRDYELAGISHLPTGLLPFKALGVRPPTAHDQDYVDFNPVFRAMATHLHRWVRGAGCPPASEVLDGHVVQLSKQLIVGPTWSTSDQSWAIDLGPDGNANGGIRMPSVQTNVGRLAIGAPLGIYRGIECDGDPRAGDYIVNCPASGVFPPNSYGQYNMIAGTFVPYTSVDPAKCGGYASMNVYKARAAAAALYAALRGWVLPDDVLPLVDSAVSVARLYPGCVPDAT